MGVLKMPYSATANERSGRLLPRVLGLTASIPVLPQLGLGLPLSAPLSLALLPLRRQSPRPRFYMTLVVLPLLTVVALFVSARANHTALASAAIGHSLMFIVSIAAYRVAIRDMNQAAILALWFYTGYLVSVLAFPPDERVYGLGLEGFWKFGVGTPITILVVGLINRYASRASIVGTALVAFGGLSFGVGFRSLGVACFASVFLMVVRSGLHRSGRSLKVAASVVSLSALAWVLELAVVSGVFGEDVATRTASQTAQGGPAILGGRSEPPLSLAAIAMRFWTGWGNAQYLDGDVFALGVRYAESLGMGTPSNYMGYWVRYDGFVSLHSIVLGTWVEGGVLAALFPIFLLALFGCASVLAAGRWAPLVTVLAVKTGWDLLFSPWSSNRGVQLAVVAIVCMLALRDHADFRGTSDSGLDAREPGNDAEPVR